MKITDDYLNKPEVFKDKNIVVPTYDVAEMRAETLKNPEWVHFGGGNLYRCFHAQVAQDLLNSGDLKTGIVVVETFGEDLIDSVYHDFDNRSLTVEMKTDGSFEKTLVAATAEALYFHKNNVTDVASLVTIFKAESLQLVTLTITEKGYAVKDSAGELLAQVVSDLKVGPEFDQLANTMSKLTYLLLERFNANQTPLAMVSTDNFSHNGDRLKAAILEIAQGWYKAGHVSADFVAYLSDDTKISFPFSMIDRITPLPNGEIAEQLENSGIEKMKPFVTDKQKMVLSAFVNTEEVHYLAIEDKFPNGRPALEKASGVLLGNRETINKADLMKVCTCLNPLHTTLAIFGCLLGFDRIYKEVEDEDLLKLIEQVGFIEGLPVVENPEIIQPEQFINEVIYKRFANPNIPDMPERIATDTSQKIGIRFGETLKAYVAAPDKDVRDLTFIPLTIAAWCRYLLALDDNGVTFEVSPDPLLPELQAQLSTVKLGSENVDLHQILQPILRNDLIFGLDLVDIGLADKIENFFAQLIKETGSVRKVLQATLATHAKDIQK
ncbi:mannitol dehydrogenase [Lactococcus hodotermopsidis]|uniref:Mannitol dehydrogenase n=1 Tax=Pseudolactococcus hodotermopsidis TaxID=2709157 RepID=A0A6A0B9J5_9LACT|nr:mannitol dehydrogenase family protein [Lactococcus hodotermopsidis]GFH42042.1 mannitol dehydrogenase [Lactococcus hodotermopsidis]